MEENKKKEKVNREVERVVKYYESEYPKEGELVTVECISCEENGCYVELLEYERKKGMIPLNEYTTSMRRNMQRAMKVGRVEIARVTKVDTNKGYIDLSKSKVNQDDEKFGDDKFAKAKATHSIVVNISNETYDVNRILTEIVWPLYQKSTGTHPHDFIKQVLMENEGLFRKEDKAEELGFTDPKLKADLIAELKRRYKKPVVKSIAIFKVSIKSFDGIIKIKEILKAGAEEGKKKDYDVKITILGAPDYLCEISTSTKEEGEEALMIAINKIKEEAAKAGGEFDLKQKPKVVGDSNHSIHQILAEELDNQDQPDDDDQMGEEDDQ